MSPEAPVQGRCVERDYLGGDRAEGGEVPHPHFGSRHARDRVPPTDQLGDERPADRPTRPRDENSHVAYPKWGYAKHALLVRPAAERLDISGTEAAKLPTERA